MKSFVKNVLAIFIGSLIALLLLEIFLCIYNPFVVQIKRNKFVVPVNHKYIFNNTYIKGLDTNIVHTRNSIGFRGEELPENIKEKISVITIGGSTTACLYMSDGDDWPNVVAKKMKEKIPALWLNNAGFEGHSTLGHEIVLKDYVSKISPRYVLFLTGINDVELNEKLFLANGLNDGNFKIKDWKIIAIENSELASTTHNLYLVYLARKKSVTHFSLNMNSLDVLYMTEQQIDTEKQKQKKYLSEYKARIQRLIRICEQHNIIPVFITQPLLFGDVIDPETNKNLGLFKFNKTRNGLAQWQILELYNEVTRLTCKEKDLLCIDLARKLPKDQSLFYDGIHFSKEGSEKVGEIVAENLAPYIINSEMWKNVKSKH